MNFPITFSTPSEAVRCIYEMKQSNPSAILEIEYDDRVNGSYKDIVTYTEEDGLDLCMDTSLSIERGRVLAYASDIEGSEIESISITSIQSQIPKLKRGDKVFIISMNLEGVIDSDMQGGAAYEVSDFLTEFQEWPYEEPPTDNEVFGEFPSRDIIKLPLPSNTSK